MKLLSEGIENQAVQLTKQVAKITIDGKTDNYPVYRVRLDCLFYNDKNDRIATWISKYQSEHGDTLTPKKDKERYNRIIQKFVEESNPEQMKKTQENIKLLGQQRHGVVLNDGRIIDGNRRFSCLRNLIEYSDEFNYFETVILDKDYEHSEKQIKMLELQIQIGAEERVDYDPVDRLVGIYRDIEDKKLLTIDEYARSTNQTKNKVQKELEIAKLLVEFLESINAPKEYYLARDLQLDGPIRELYVALKNINNEDKRQQLKYEAFINLLIKPDKDMTRFIRNLKSISKSNYLEEFLDEEEEITEKILDELSETEKINQDIISKLRADEDAKELLSRTMTKVSTKIKAKETKDKPSQMILNAIDALDAIDINILRFLNENQLDDMRQNIIRLETLINKLKETIDV